MSIEVIEVNTKEVIHMHGELPVALAEIHHPSVCAECGTDDVSVMILSQNIRVSLCEFCLKKLALDINRRIFSLSVKCKNCVHYLKQQDWSGECHLRKINDEWLKKSPNSRCQKFLLRKGYDGVNTRAMDLPNEPDE